MRGRSLLLNLLARNTTSFSPVASKLSANMTAAAPMDAQQATEICDKLLSQMETRLIARFQQNSTQQSHNGSIPLVHKEYFRLLDLHLDMDSQLLHPLVVPTTPHWRLLCSTSTTRLSKSIRESYGIQSSLLLPCSSGNLRTTYTRAILTRVGKCPTHSVKNPALFRYHFFPMTLSPWMTPDSTLILITNFSSPHTYFPTSKLLTQNCCLLCQ